jgi:cell division protein FtsB|tara:strand:- start:277 stop:486 length:210 start_codon:yes stop_codon:yes gene_type:complete
MLSIVGLFIIGLIIVVIIGCIAGFIYYLSKDKKEQPAQNGEMGHLSNRIKALEVEVTDLKRKLTDHKHD